MTNPFIIEDPFGDNYVDSLTRKKDEAGTIFYEVHGRNNEGKVRILLIYANDVYKPYVGENGTIKEVATEGAVHRQMRTALPQLLNHFELNKLDFFNTPLTLVDPMGDNYVDAVERQEDANGIIYYEIRGRNAANKIRVSHVYENEVISFIESDGALIKMPNKGAVHKQFEQNMSTILAHFSIKTPLEFTNPKKASDSNPKKNPAFLPMPVQADLPSREFFLAAAKRVMRLGDKVTSDQTGGHLTRAAFIGKGSIYYKEGKSTRLNLFRELIAGTKKDGYWEFAATTAYGLSLLTYIATHYDKLSETEVKRLYQLYQTVAGVIPDLDLDPSSSEYRKALAQGLKAEINDLTSMRERLSYGYSIDTALADYTRDLVEGNSKGRAIIDKETSFIPEDSSGSLTRPIPGFFPIPPMTSTTDQIVLGAGGCKSHFAVVCIWKQGIDSDGNPVLLGDGKTIERYKVYRTVCNAGFGTSAHIRTIPPALYHEHCNTTADGKSYSVCTQEILLPPGVSYTHEAMQKQISKLIQVERQLKMHHDAPIAGPNGEQGTSDPVKQKQWRQLNESIPLGPVEKTHSVLSKPQVTGNCSVRSIQEHLRWELVKNGMSHEEAADILDKHWEFARTNDSASLNTKLSSLESKVTVDKTSPKKSSAKNINLVNPQVFFDNPSILKFPEYYPDSTTDEETKLLTEKIQSGSLYCPKPTMISMHELVQLATKKSIGSSEGSPGMYLLQHCDSRKAAQFSCMQGGVRQIASQFNNGESMGRYETPPSQFKNDPTQGPAEQRSSGGAALARYAYNKDCDCFAVLLTDPVLKTEFEQLFDYEFGYLTPKGGKEQQGVAFLRQHIDKLILNVERVSIDGVPNQTAIQILNSGLALGDYDKYMRTPENLPYLSEMTQLLMSAQYKAVAAVAILEAQNNPTKRIPLSLTLVGGGVFGNDKLAIAKAASEAIKFIKNSGVSTIDICLSIYTPSAIEQYKKLTDKGEEYAELRALLNQIPISESDLESLPAFQAPLKKEVKPSTLKNEKLDKSAEDKETPPGIQDKKIITNKHINSKIDKDIKRIDLKSNDSKNIKSGTKGFQPHPKVLDAMNEAIKALSLKSHLSSTEGVDKKIALEKYLKAYQDSRTPKDANQALLSFIIKASTQRQSNWSSFFTSKYGETASAKAFYKQMDSGRLNSLLAQATNVPLSITSNFKEFAAKVREQYEGKDYNEENNDLKL